MEQRIELAQAIAVVREQLATAMDEGKGKPVQFAVGPIDLEFLIEVGWEGGGGGKLRVWIVEAGGDAKRTTKSTQTLKIHLDPLDAVTKKQVVVAEVDRGSAPPRPTAGVG